MIIKSIQSYTNANSLKNSNNNYSHSRNKITFKGALEDEFFRASKSGDFSTQLRNLKDLKFDVSEIDTETGSNFLHFALKSGNKSIINQALILFSRKAVNDKDLADTIVNKFDNSDKKPYDYTEDSAVINNLQRITGKEIASASVIKTEPTAQKVFETVQDSKLNELPTGTVIKVPSLDDEDDESIDVEPLQMPELPLSLKSLPLVEIAGHNAAKEILLKRIVKPISEGRQVIDSGFLIHDNGSNGKTFLLNSLEKSLNRKKIDAKTLGGLIDEAIENSNGDKVKQKRDKASILSQNIIQVKGVQELETVAGYAEENYANTGQQTIIFVDEIKGLLPDVTAPYSKEVTFIEQLIENSASRGFILVATTREKDAIKPESVRQGRFDEHIELKLPNDEEREEVIKKYFPISSELSEKEFSSFIKLTSGFSYLNLTKFLNRLDESESANFEYIEKELQKYAKENGLGKLSDKGTTVNFDPVDLPREPIKIPKNFSDVAGMKDVKYKFQELLIDSLTPEAIARFKKHGNLDPITAGFVLSGAPGTGKTYIVKALAGELGIPLYKMTSSTIKDKWVGESEKKVTRIFDQLEKKFEVTGEYSILFIDEADALLAKRENSNELDAKLVNLFLQKIEGSAQRGVITIVATNFKDNIDSAVLSRLGEQIEVSLPDAELRKSMINLEFDKIPEITGNISEDERNELASRLSGFTSRDINYILSTTIRKHLNKSEEPLTVLAFKTAINIFAKDRNLPEINDRNKTSAHDTFLKRVQITHDDPQTLDELGGMKEVKGKLIEALGFDTENPDIVERLKANKGKPRAGVLLYGEPGCGKTYIMKAAAAHFNLPLYEFKLSEQGGTHIHETSQNIGKIFKQLKDKYEKTGGANGGERSILMLDEFEDIARQRDGNSYTAYKQEETDTLLKEISNAPKNGIIVVAATNFYNQIDDAIKRKGRFTQIYVPYPDNDSRVDILKKSLKDREIAENVVSNEENIKRLAEYTDGFSVVEITETINELVDTSVRNRVDKLTLDDLTQAFEQTRQEKELAKEKGK